MDTPVVFVVRVRFAVSLVAVDIGQGLKEFLPGVGDFANQLIVEPQDTPPVLIGVVLLVSVDVVAQGLFQPIQTGNHLAVKGLPQRSRQE